MPNDKPNIVFAHIDQMHHLAFSHLGNPHVATPGFDEISVDGCTMARAVSSNPLCCPERSSWYTGRMSSETGVYVNNWPCRQDLPDLGHILGAAGYDCYYGGKWHIPARNPADSFKIVYPIITHGERHDEALAATGEAFFKSYKGDKPFFLNLGFLNPHDCCYLVNDAIHPAFKAGMEKILGDANLPPLPPNYNPKEPLPKAGAHWTQEQARLYLYIYYRMCETVDAAVSRVYRALKASPFFENTIFITGADHGDMMTEHNRFGKMVPWNASSCVPLRVVGPNRIAAGSTNNHWVQGVDVSSTIVDYAGAAPIDNGGIGRSFRRQIEGKSNEEVHDYIVSESNAPDTIAAFRHGDTKTVFHLGHNTVEFYDLANDPWEMHDLAANGANPPGLDDHRAFLKDYQSRVRYTPVYRESITDGKIRGEAPPADE